MVLPIEGRDILLGGSKPGSMQNQGCIQLSCPAKINLALSVGAPLENGLHPLASWMVTIDFVETLTLHRIDDKSASRFELSNASEPATAGNDHLTSTMRPQVRIDWPIENDLTYRAHALMEKQVGRPLPIHLSLGKRIPTGAGLGGGSSNAAATVVGLNRLFDLRLDDPTLRAIGQQLGSDVAFLMHATQGHGSALVSGLGDQIEPMPLAQPIHLVLIFPGFGCPTGRVYGAFDQMHRNKPYPSTCRQSIRQMAEHLPLAPDAPRNDLAQAAFVVQPELGKIADRLHQQLQMPVHVTGSGSTLFLVAPSATACAELAEKATAATNLPAVTTQTLDPTPSRTPTQ